MGRPKLDPDVKQSATFTAKIRPAEREALAAILKALNVERLEKGEIGGEITGSDWLRHHIRLDAKARGIVIEEGPALEAQKVQKGSKPVRKLARSGGRS